MSARHRCDYPAETPCEAPVQWICEGLGDCVLLCDEHHIEAERFNDFHAEECFS